MPSLSVIGRMWRTFLAFGAALAVLAAFLFILGPAALIARLAEADPGVFAVGLLAVLGALLCWSLALRRLLRCSSESISVGRAFVAYAASMFGKQVLPMGHAGGPALVAYAFERETGLSYDRTLGVVTVSEFLNFAASLLLAVVGTVWLILFAPAVPEIRVFQAGVAAFAIGLGAAAAVFWYRRRTVTRLAAGAARLGRVTVGRLSSRVDAALAPDRVTAGIARYYETIDAVAEDRRAVGAAYVYTQVGWILFALPLYTAGLAIDADVSLALALFLVPAAGLVTVVPLPGGLGGFELVLAGALVAFAGLELAVAGAVVVLYRLCAYWFMVVVGGMGSVYGTATVRDMARRAGE